MQILRNKSLRRHISGLFQNSNSRHSEDERSSDEESAREEILRFAQNDEKAPFRNSPISWLRYRSIKAYSVMEIVVSILIIGLMTSFALPSYTIMVEKTRAREGVQLLDTIRQGEMAYKQKYGNYWVTPPNTATCTGVEDETGIDIPWQGKNFYDVRCGCELFNTPRNGWKCVGAATRGTTDGAHDLYYLFIYENGEVTCITAPSSPGMCEKIGIIHEIH